MIYHCGPFWFPQWLKKILSKRFNEACYIHDANYRNKPVARREADIQLLKDMLNSNGSVYLAMLFYIAVRIGGWISWRRNAQ